jgi:hypothetical protein
MLQASGGYRELSLVAMARLALALTVAAAVLVTWPGAVGAASAVAAALLIAEAATQWHLHARLRQSAALGTR